MSKGLLQEILSQNVKLTPMMAQYVSVKQKHPDTLVLYRMGDFYELFFDDAKEASRLLNIALTHRGKLGEYPIPMAGIPHHAAATYIDRLTEQGLKVVICEQVEDPKEAKGIVKREVTQIVSPGLPYDLEKTEGKDRRFMATVWHETENFYLTLLDFTTGEFIGQKFSSERELVQRLELYSPKEFLLYLGQWEGHSLIKQYLEREGLLKTHLSQECFSPKDMAIYIERLVPSYKSDKVLRLDRPILCAIGAISYYICSTQGLEKFYHIRPFRMLGESGRMKVTQPVLVGLEICPSHRDNYKDSLLGYLDRTQTAMGGREMRQQFLGPLTDLNELQKRHDLVAYLLEQTETLLQLREKLSHIRDLERIMAKVTTKKANSVDLLALDLAIHTYFEIKELLQNAPTTFLKDSQALRPKVTQELKELAQKIRQTLNDEIGASLEKGNLIRPGAHKERDQLAKLSADTTDEVLKLEAHYRKSTGIANLKIRSNNITGHYIEVSKSHLSKVPAQFERRQTLVNAERFVTKRLIQFEKEVIAAQEKLERLERQIFTDLIEQVASLAPPIAEMSKQLSLLDFFQSLAWVAQQEDFIRPKLHENKKVLKIKGAWHPLIRGALKDQFVCHDLVLNEERYFGLITGPNMAGKTTVMREMAIIQFLAQIGSFVPAQEAELGLCDQLFSRLGASDNILRGQSTFMVEMTETAEIIRHATSRSLIVIDEIGRGTSTFDGLSIAWSLVEHFVRQVKALTLFSTHYHELTDLVETLPGAKNLTVETKSQNGDVKFLYRLLEDRASQSYGIFVAKLAGLPHGILKRSEDVLKNLELEHQGLKPQPSTQEGTSTKKTVRTEKRPYGMQLSFFPEEEQSALAPQVPPYLKELEEKISKIDVLNLTPLEALNRLHDLKNGIPLQ